MDLFRMARMCGCASTAEEPLERRETLLDMFVLFTIRLSNEIINVDLFYVKRLRDAFSVGEC